jgi:hypothetical protein
MAGKLKEDVEITIKDTQKSNKFATYVVNIDEKGNGSIETDELSSFLELIILPLRFSPTTSFSIKSVSFPELQVLNFVNEDTSLRVLPIRMQCYDNTGKIIQTLDKYPLLGRYVIDVTSAVPNSQLSISLIWG